METFETLRNYLALLDDPQLATGAQARQTAADLIVLLKEFSTRLNKSDVSTLSKEECLNNLDLLLKAIGHSKVSIDLALACGNLCLKLVTLSGENVRAWLEEKTRSSDQDFLWLTLATGCLNNSLTSPELMRDIFVIIQKCCLTPSSHDYQSFQALRLWSSKAKSTKLALFQDDEAALRQLLDLINANWENPMRGITDLLTDTLGNVLDLVHRPELNMELMESTMTGLSWKMKSKYPPLTVLLPRVGVINTLSNYSSEFSTGLVQSLTSNHLASAGASVYRLIVKTKGIFDVWKQLLMKPFLFALTIDESTLVRSNAKHHWLNPTISSLPKEAGDAMIEALDDSDQCWMARFLVFKGQRNYGFIDKLTRKHLDLLREGVHHSSSDVRLAAFSALCHTKKKASPPSMDEFDLIAYFVSTNLTVDDAAFRQVFVSDFTQLMIRSRDYCVVTHRRQSKRPDRQKSDSLDPAVKDVLVQVDAIMRCLFTNLIPDANYQRLVTSLELLHVLNLCFFAYNSTGMNKGSANGNPTPLVEAAQSLPNGQQLMQFQTNMNFKRLLASCVMHYMSNVKMLAFELLLFFRPCDFLETQVFEEAVHLSCSPKFGECESASLLFALCLRWRQNRKKRGQQNQDTEEQQRDNSWTKAFLQINLCENKLLKCCIEGSLKREATQLTPLLLDLYKSLFERRDDLFAIAKSAPMHGLLTCLRRTMVLEDLSCTSFFQDLVKTLKASTDFMLTILSGGEKGKNASFADMSLAVEAVVSEHLKVDEDDNSVNISDEHSLVLACAWLNLKECALVASQIVDVESADLVHEAGMVMTTVLTGSRHKGALEAAASALGDFSSHLFQSTDPKLSVIPHRILSTVLESIEDSHTASVTRRSAGLPMLVRSIVSSEPRGSSGGRALLLMTVEQLCCITERSTIQRLDVKSVEKSDIPECHAIHILRALVHDAALSHDIAHYLPRILKHCIQQFHSPIWAVRNAALQLFGALMPRILGQKKVRIDNDDKDDSVAGDSIALHNSVTAQDLFTRHSDLAEFLQQQLVDVKTKSGITNPALVPILSMLSRVAPGIQMVGDEKLARQLAMFRRQFLSYFCHQEMAVRVLASKCYISFTLETDLVNQLVTLADLALENKNASTNFVHGCLSSLSYGVKLLKSEYSSVFKARMDDLKKVFEKIMALDSKCFMIKLKIKEIESLVVEDKVKAEPPPVVNGDFHPGARDFQIKFCLQGYETQQNDMNLDECKSFINRIKHQNIVNTTLPRRDLDSIGEFLTDNAINNEVVNGPLVEECNILILSNKNLLMEDSELAIDFLDILGNDKIIRKKRYGQSAMSSSIVTMALCMTSMMLKDDFEMFFGAEADGSQYVSQFCELADLVLALSRPEQQEVSRLHAAEAILQLVDMFNVRVLRQELEKCSLSVHLRLGLVQILNAALNLLSDEEGDIRQKVLQFASKLTATEIISRYTKFYDKVATAEAFEKVTLVGLCYFEDLADWFAPVININVINNDSDVWTFKKDLKGQLFESGDGINVFAEESVVNDIYTCVLLKWLAKNLDSKFRMVDGSAQSLMDKCSAFDLQVNEVFGGQYIFDEFAKPKTFVKAKKVTNFLTVIIKYHSTGIAQDISEQDLQQLVAIRDRIENVMMQK